MCTGDILTHFYFSTYMFELTLFSLKCVPLYLFLFFFSMWHSHTHEIQKLWSYPGFLLFLVLTSQNSLFLYPLFLSPSHHHCIYWHCFSSFRFSLEQLWLSLLPFLPCLPQNHILQNCQIELNEMKNVNSKWFPEWSPQTSRTRINWEIIWMKISSLISEPPNL